MKNTYRILISGIAGLAALLGSVSASASLEWVQAEQVFQAQLQDKTIEARYAFTNTGAEVVTITDVKTSCGCTAAKPDKKRYQPGEGGAIAATFTIGNRRGRNVKKIVVHCSDEAQPRKDLILTVDIPELLRPNRSTVYWHQDRSAAPQTVILSAKSRHEVVISKVVVSHTNLVVAQTETTPGREFALTLTPQSVAAPINARVTIEARPRDVDMTKTYTVYTRILPKPRAR